MQARLQTEDRHQARQESKGLRESERQRQAETAGHSRQRHAAPTPAPTGIFEAPGKQLEGEAAKPFLQKYLLNSRFTDCPTGWPSCGGFEDRYSHTADNTFYKCLLRPTSGSDVKSVGEFGIQNARIEADGSWIFQELVSWYGEITAFEWRVAANGLVEGAVQGHGGEAPQTIGPLQYVSGPRLQLLSSPL